LEEYRSFALDTELGDCSKEAGSWRKVIGEAMAKKTVKTEIACQVGYLPQLKFICLWQLFALSLRWYQNPLGSFSIGVLPVVYNKYSNMRESAARSNNNRKVSIQIE